MRRREARATSAPVVAAGLVGATFLALPLLALLVRAPWGRMAGIVQGPTVARALGLSLGSSAVATLVCLLLGVPLAWLLVHCPPRIATWLRALVTVPLVLPPVVGGVALLMTFGRMGLLGRPLEDWFGIRLGFTTAAVVMAQVFVSMPFLVVGLEGSLCQRDRELEEAAQTMGAGPRQVLWHITLPLQVPSLLSGLVLCWARALGEFGATITFAGNFPGTTQTMPLAVYLAMQGDPDAAIALSVVLLVVCVTVLVLLRGSWLPALLPGSD